MRVLIIIVCITLLYGRCNSQQSDSLLTTGQTAPGNSTSAQTEGLNRLQERKPLLRSLVAPALLTTYGFVAIENNRLKSLDKHIKEEVWTEHPHQPNHFDDGLQYIPGFSVFVLNGLDVPGKNNLLDATRQYFISSFVMMVVVQSIKKITSLKRPDGFGSNTFPSGHTSTAFVAAEFLNQEYKDRSPWYSIAGYTMAAAVGYMRIYNNRHWLKDVISGAGIGIGVTKFVYWIYPSIKRKFFKDRPQSTMIMPYYQKGSAGISLVRYLH